MLYKEIKPDKSLEHIIQCFWLLEHDYREKFHTHEHLWADTHTELIFSFGNPYYLKTKAGRKILPKNFVIGPFTKELMLYSDGFTGFVAVRFKEWGIYPFANKPMKTIVNNIVTAEEIFGDCINSMIRDLEVMDREEKIQTLDMYFRTDFSQRNAETSSPPIASKIINEKGIVKIPKLAGQFGINSRQLERIFETEIGLSAKLFSRIVRFNHARRLIEKNNDIGLSQLTYEAGYSDQSHFSNNFREMFNITPAGYKRELKEFMDHFDENDIDVAFLQD